MEQPTSKLTSMSGTFAIISLAVGILGLISFFYPPAQLLCGATALILAYLSRTGKKLTGLAIGGIVLGIISILLSIFFFQCFLSALRFMDDPANVAAYNSAMEQLLSQYDALMGVVGGLSTK